MSDSGDLCCDVFNLSFVVYVHDQGVVWWSGLGCEYAVNSNWVQGICSKSIYCLGGECNKPAAPNDHASTSACLFESVAFYFVGSTLSMWWGGGAIYAYKLCFIDERIMRHGIHAERMDA